MKKIKTNIKGLFILQGKKFTDQRGWLKETFKENHFKKKMVFSITSKSKKNVLRGLHLQTKKKQLEQELQEIDRQLGIHRHV